MGKMHLNGSIVFYDDFGLEKNDKLKNFLESEELKNIINSFSSKIIVVLGGDGTMLRAIRENYDKNYPFLGINFGSKGFLLNSKEAVYPGFTSIERKYPLLEVEVGTSQEKKNDIAMNEIDIRAGSGRVISLELKLLKRQSINISGDGIIISTPAGSTGYNRSLNGPIIPHTINAFSITPKAPWMPRGQGPILIQDNEFITIKNTKRLNPINIYCDGREFLEVSEGNSLDITIKKSSKFVSLIIGGDYVDIWDNKVMQEQGFEI